MANDSARRALPAPTGDFIGLDDKIHLASGGEPPLLVVVFAALGLSALNGVLDYVLLPALAFFIALTVYALWKSKRQTSS